VEIKLMARLTVGVVIALILLAAGCHASVPRTYPAKGSVRYRGGQPMKGGSVQFNSLTDPALRVVGRLRDDGTFTLETSRDGDKRAGAPAGEYEVTVFPPLSGEHKGAAPIVLPTLYRVEAEGKNEFAIELNEPAPPP
jgi:hypothetical protein